MYYRGGFGLIGFFYLSWLLKGIAIVYGIAMFVAYWMYIIPAILALIGIYYTLNQLSKPAPFPGTFACQINTMDNQSRCLCEKHKNMGLRQQNNIKQELKTQTNSTSL